MHLHPYSLRTSQSSSTSSSSLSTIQSNTNTIINPISSSTLIPTITVADTEVPLPLYFQALDLYIAGHNLDSILVHIVGSQKSRKGGHLAHPRHHDVEGPADSHVDLLREVIRQVMYNQDLVGYSNAASVTASALGDGQQQRLSVRSGLVAAHDDEVSIRAERRSSRIEFVEELDDLNFVSKIAGKGDGTEISDSDGNRDREGSKIGSQKEKEHRTLRELLARLS